MTIQNTLKLWFSHKLQFSQRDLKSPHSIVSQLRFSLVPIAVTKSKFYCTLNVVATYILSSCLVWTLCMFCCCQNSFYLTLNGGCLSDWLSRIPEEIFAPFKPEEAEKEKSQKSTQHYPGCYSRNENIIRTSSKWMQAKVSLKF